MAVPPGCPLSDREYEVLHAAVRHGGVRKAIAHALGVRPSTVRSHTANIYEQLGVGDLSQAVLVALRAGWVDLNAVAPPPPAPEPVPESKLRAAEQVYLQAFEPAAHARDSEALQQAKYRTDAAMVGLKPEWVWSRSVADRGWMDRLVRDIAAIA